MSKYKEVLKYIQLYTGCSEHALKRIDAMLHDKINVVPRVEIKYIETFARKGIAPDLTLKEWADKYYKDFNTNYKELTNRSRKTDVVINRNRFLIAAYKEGYGASELGRFLGFCHASILHGLHESKKK